jgi:hypothetical protein
MKAEYRIQETERFVIDYLLLMIDYFFRVNLSLSAVPENDYYFIRVHSSFI